MFTLILCNCGFLEIDAEKETVIAITVWRGERNIFHSTLFLIENIFSVSAMIWCILATQIHYGKQKLLVINLSLAFIQMKKSKSTKVHQFSHKKNGKFKTNKKNRYRIAFEIYAFSKRSILSFTPSPVT